MDTVGPVDTRPLPADWAYVADSVMGGVSTGRLDHITIQGRSAARLTGDVSLDNNGGFVQMATDLPAGSADGWTGIEIDVTGNGQDYDLRLRTDDLQRPWQSFRAAFTAPAQWTTLRLPFDAFVAHRTDCTFVPARLRRIGVLAIGREFHADLALSDLRLYWIG